MKKAKTLMIIVVGILVSCCIACTSSETKNALNDSNSFRIGLVDIDVNDEELGDIEPDTDYTVTKNLSVENIGKIPYYVRVTVSFEDDIIGQYVSFSSNDSDFYSLEEMPEYLEDWIYISPDDEEYGETLGGYYYYPAIVKAGEEIGIIDKMKINIPSSVYIEGTDYDVRCTAYSMISNCDDIWDAHVEEELRQKENITPKMEVTNNQVINNTDTPIYIRVVSDVVEDDIDPFNEWDYEERGSYTTLPYDTLEEKAEYEYVLERIEPKSSYRYMYSLQPGEVLELPEVFSGCDVEYIEAPENFLEEWVLYSGTIPSDW